jgi:hypothetical protein
MTEQNKCNFNFKKVHRPQSAIAMTQDHRITYVSKRELVSAYIPAVTVCQKLCTNSSLPCPSVESRLILQFTGEGGTFYDSFSEGANKVLDETTPVLIWNSGLTPIEDFKFRDINNFVFFISFADEAKATKKDDHILLNCPVAPGDAIIMLSDNKEDAGGNSLLIVLNTGAEDIPSLYSITLGEQFDDDINKTKIFFSIEGERIIFNTSNDDGISVGYPTTTSFLSQYVAVPSGDNVIMISYNKNGVVTCMVNNIRFKFKSPIIKKYPLMRIEVANYCSSVVAREVEVKEFYLFDTAENSKIRNFYNSLLDKYSLSDWEFGPDLYLFSHRGTVKSTTYNWTNYPGDGYPETYLYCLRDYTAKATYVNTQSALSYFGTILSGMFNSSGESMSLTNITFSGSPPAGFKNNLSVVKFYDPGDTGSGTTTNLNQDYPIQIETQLSGDKLNYTIKSSYSTVMTYTGVMTLHIEFKKKSYLIDIPIVHNIT